MNTINWDPSTRVLRQFAAFGTILLAGMATATFLRAGGSATVVLLVALAIGLGLIGGIRPNTLRLPYLLLTLAVYPIGMVVSHLILLVLFFVVITPLGWLSRSRRPDPLDERWDTRAQSYWRARPRPRDASSYLRQA